MSENQSFKDLNLENQYLTHLIQGFSYSIINDATKIQPTDYIIIDKSDNYFICSYDRNIYFINTDDNFTLAHVNFANVNSNNIILLKDDIQSKLDCLKARNIVKDTNFLQIINNFVKFLYIKIVDTDNEQTIDYFKMSQLSIAACLVGNSYLNKKNRFLDYVDDFRLLCEYVHVKDSDYISLGRDGFQASNSVDLIYLISKEKLCIKKRFISNNNYEFEKIYKREKNNYIDISHPLIPKLIGYDDNSHILYIEYIPGQTLYQIVNNLTNSQKIKIMFELSAIFMYIHNHNFIYRDLKPNNVILDRNGMVFLIDYDKMIPNPQPEEDATRDFGLIYPAPEIQNGLVSNKSDIFSLSKLIYFIFTGEENKNKIDKKLFKEKIDCDDLLELIKKCLNKSPNERCSISDFIKALYSIFITKRCDFIYQNDINDILKCMVELSAGENDRWKSIIEHIFKDYPLFKDKDNAVLKNIIAISDFVSIIGPSLVEENSSLEEITINSIVSIIRPSSFQNNSSLRKITINSRVSIIQDYAFFKCKSLENIRIENLSISKFGASSFSGCSLLNKITIPSSISTIATCTFCQCSKLEKIVIPSSVTSIGNYAFRSCSALHEIIFETPSSVKLIGIGAFFKCTSLEKIEIPPSVKKIDSEAFNKCLKLKEIRFFSFIKSIEKITFLNVHH